MANFFETYGTIISVVIMIGLTLFYLDYSGSINIPFFKGKNKPADDKADKKLLNVLNRFARVRGFDVLGKTTLEFEGARYTFDAIILGFYGTIAFNSLSANGEIYGAINDEQWVQIFDGKRTEFANPTKALVGTPRFFKDIYRTERAKCGMVDSMMVFTGSKAATYITKNNSNTCVMLDKLYQTLDTVKRTSDNGADIPAMKAALAKYTVQ